MLRAAGLAVGTPQACTKCRWGMQVSVRRLGQCRVGLCPCLLGWRLPGRAAAVHVCPGLVASGAPCPRLWRQPLAASYAHAVHPV